MYIVLVDKYLEEGVFPGGKIVWRLLQQKSAFLAGESILPHADELSSLQLQLPCSYVRPVAYS